MNASFRRYCISHEDATVSHLERRCASTQPNSCQLDRPMVVAVVAVGMVQMAIDEVVDMIAMGNCFMPTPRAMDMVCGVTTAGVALCTGDRVCVAHLKRMLVHMIAVGVMQVAIVQIIHMTIVADRRMAAIWPVNVVVVSVLVTVCHVREPPQMFCTVNVL